MAAAAEARALAMREAATKASARAEAVTWKRGNPSEPAAGLSPDQADLVIALSNSAKAYQKNKGHAPRARVTVLDGIERGPLGKRWTKERAVEVAESIPVLWPLPGRGGSPTVRQLYVKAAGPGRQPHEREEEEARVLVEGVEHLRPLAEQVFAEPSGE